MVGVGENKDLAHIDKKYQLTIVNYESVISFKHAIFEIIFVIDFSIKLSKVWKRSCSHPNNQVFI